MGNDGRPPITAASLRASEVWGTSFPGSIPISESDADEGTGIAFDGIDPSASVLALFRTPSPWDEVLEWYRERLESRGWRGREVAPATWWVWSPPSGPGTRFDVLYRGQYERLPGWAVPEEFLGMTCFQVEIRATSRPGVVPGESSTFANA
jgi:hypothetical protein